MAVRLPPNWKIEENETHINNFRNFDWANSSPDDWINFAKAGPWPEPGISRNECRALMDAMIVYGRSPITILEIGQCYGSSTRLFLGKVLRDGGEFHSCEINVREPFKAKMEELGYWDKFVTHNEHSQLMLWDKPIDYLFIDSEHDVEHALGEYMRFRRFMHGHALVGFHDTEICFGVRRAIDIISNEIDELELVANGEGHAGAGIRVYRIVKLGRPAGPKTFMSLEESYAKAKEEIGERLKA